MESEAQYIDEGLLSSQVKIIDSKDWKFLTILCVITREKDLFSSDHTSGIDPAFGFLQRMERNRLIGSNHSPIYQFDSISIFAEKLKPP